MRDSSAVSDCECGIQKIAIEDESFPISFDSMMGEYHLICGDESHAIMYFCPWCGGSLPESKRDTFFTKPTEEDQKDIAQKMKGVETSEQLMAILGPPSETSDNPVQTHYSYRDHWASLELVVLVRMRLLSYAVHGKFIRSESASAESE